MEDRLSLLPDDLLIQIVMLLPLIQAVRTCVLSRRWKRIWTLAQILHVVDTQVDRGGKPDQFAEAVQTILNVYTHGRVGRTRCHFRISISRLGNVDADQLTTWGRRVSRVFEGNFVLSVRTPVQPEDSDSDWEPEIFELPYFQCARRITLTLRDSFTCLALPTGAGAFASLTHLALMELCFADRAGAALGEVVSSRCPCLVSLVMRYVRGVKALTLRAASLTDLTLLCVQGLRLLDVVAPKLSDMALRCCFVASKGAVLRISAPLLKRFAWVDCSPEFTQVLGLTDNPLDGLLVGEVPHVARDEGFVAHSNFHMMLTHFRRTKNLELHLPICPDLQGHMKLMEQIVLRCQYKDLTLVVERNGHMFGMSMVLLLKRCIGLRRLHLKLGEHKGDTTCFSCIWGNPQGWKNQAVLLDSLEFILVTDFSENSHEVDIVRFILNCAPPSVKKIDIEVAHGVILSKDTVLHFSDYRQLKIFQKGERRMEKYYSKRW